MVNITLNTSQFMEVLFICKYDLYPDSKVHGANMGPTWGRQYPGGPHVGPMNFAIWVILIFDHFIGCKIILYC